MSSFTIGPMLIENAMRRLLVATICLVILLGTIFYQGSVIHQQRDLIRQMMTNPYCLVPNR